MRIEGSYISTLTKEKYIEEKIKILEAFGVLVTEDMKTKLSELYPRDIAIENYVRKWICDHLDR